MRFSLYTEMQLHDGKTPQQLYREVLEQIENADRLGLRLLRVDRALLLPEVLHLGAPDGALRRRRPADEAHPLPDDAPRAALLEPDGAGLGDRRDRHPHGRPLRVGRRPRARLDPREGGRPARRARAAAVRGGGRPPVHRARQRALLAQGRVLRGRRLARRPVPERGTSASSSAGPPTGPTSLPPSTAGASPFRRSSRTRRSRSSSTSTGRSAPSTARRRTSSGSMPATSTRIATPRCARRATG